MKKEKKEFRSLRRKVLNYNKVLVGVLALFMVYALVYSISMLDCEGVNFYTFSGTVSESQLACTNVPTGLLAFFMNYRYVIALVLLAVALVFLVLQKVCLVKINEMDVVEYEDEKVKKSNHILTTLLLGYTGLHKFRTENRKIGWIYLVNFVLFVVTFIMKTFFVATYESYLVFYCTYEFSFLFLIGIIIMNIVEAVFALMSAKDDNDMIFA